MKRAIFGGAVTLAVLAIVFSVTSSSANAYYGAGVGCPTYNTYYTNGYSAAYCVPSNYPTPVIQAPVYNYNYSGSYNYSGNYSYTGTSYGYNNGYNSGYTNPVYQTNYGYGAGYGYGTNAVYGRPYYQAPAPQYYYPTYNNGYHY